MAKNHRERHYKMESNQLCFQGQGDNPGSQWSGSRCPRVVRCALVLQINCGLEDNNVTELITADIDHETSSLNILKERFFMAQGYSISSEKATETNELNIKYPCVDSSDFQNVLSYVRFFGHCKLRSSM